MQVEHLGLSLPMNRQLRPVLRDVSLEIAQGEALGLVGESGSGKSMTARCIVRLLPPGARIDGNISFAGQSILNLSGRSLRRFRATDVSMVFQDPRAHTNPVKRIGDFLTEPLRVNQGLSREAATSRVLELMSQVLIEDPERLLHQYPHELSGGLLQRVMIAGAIATGPKLLLADEPTTALDVTTQAEVMQILTSLRHRFGLAVLFITHDLELAATTCDRTAVLYAGTIVEQQRSRILHEEPLHPYTAGLLASRPSVTLTAERLPVIPGLPVAAYNAPTGCSFAPRCPWAIKRCRDERPASLALNGGSVSCLRAPDIHHEISHPRHGATDA